MADPFRSQRFDGAEVRRIVRRAAAIAERDPGTAAVERALTREELERGAAELGIPSSAVEAALAGGDDAAGGERAPRSAFVGAPTRVLLEETVDGEPTEADREDILEAIRDATEETGSFEAVGKTMSWRLTPVYGGRGRELSVNLRSRDGRTRILVEEKLNRTAVGLFVGLGVGGGIGPMGGYIALIAKLGAIGLLAPLFWIPAMLLLARTIFGAISRRRARSARKLMTRLTQLAARWPSSSSAPTRVRVEASAAQGDAAEAEAEAKEAERDGDARRLVRPR